MGVSRETVHGFYEVFASRDALRIAPHLADHIEWHVAGPVEVFRFTGLRRGKAAVLDYLARLVPQVFSIQRFELEDVVIDGDSAGLFSKVVAVQKDTGRVIAYRCANFVRFETGKVVSMQAVTDTFDVAEQLLGHRIDPFCEASDIMDIVAL